MAAMKGRRVRGWLILLTVLLAVASLLVFLHRDESVRVPNVSTSERAVLVQENCASSINEYENESSTKLTEDSSPHEALPQAVYAQSEEEPDSSEHNAFIAPTEAAHYVQNELLVSVSDQAGVEELGQLLASVSGVAEQTLSAIDVQHGYLTLALDANAKPENVIAELATLDSPLIEGAQANYIYELIDFEFDEQSQPAQELQEYESVPVNDPRTISQWGLESVCAYEAWEQVTCAGQPSVAVFDTGFDLTHEDIADNIVAGSAYNSYDMNYDVSPLVSGTAPNLRYNSHGMHVAGIIGAVANNGLGIAGVSYNAKIVPVKVFENKGYAYTDTLVRAYDWVLDHPEFGVRVVNLSVGAAFETDQFEDDWLARKAQEALDAGIVSVAAAANVNLSNDSTLDDKAPFYAYPSDSSRFVSAINLKRSTNPSEYNDASSAYEVSRSSSSNYNVSGQGGVSTRVGKNISAPGEAILSTGAQNNYLTMSGTSMASPYVAGVVALIFAANPDLTADQAIDLLFRSAHDLGALGWDAEYGYGEVDAATAVELALKSRVSGVQKTFLDVPAAHWAYKLIFRAAELGLVNGYANGLFGPDDFITRGQATVILWKMAGSPQPESGLQSFPDVASDTFYSKALAWAAVEKVVSGYKNGLFGPNDLVTREQLAVMMANYARSTSAVNLSGSRADFLAMSDADYVASWAETSVGWCFSQGILSGTNAGLVSPKSHATRAQAAKICVLLYALLAA